MIHKTIRKYVRIEDLKFLHINDPEIDNFLRQEVSALWEVMDWQLAKKEIIIRIDHLLLKGGEVKIAWYGWNMQAKKIFSDILEKYKSKSVDWFLIVEDSSLADGYFSIENVSLDNWQAGCFDLTINVGRDCPEIFSAPLEGEEGAVLSPFIDEKCLLNAWSVSLRNAENFVEKISRDIKKNKVVVFVALRHGNVPSIEHIAKGLNQLPGIKAYGVYLEVDAPAATYEDVFLCHYSLGLLAELLYRLPPVTVYLQAHASWAYLGQFVCAVNEKLRVVQEVYDWMGAFIADEALFAQEGVFSQKQISLMRQSEDCICNHSDGYVYKDDGPWMQQKVRDSKSPMLKIYPCPSDPYLKSPVGPKDGSVIKLVYAGQVSHKKLPQKIFGDMYYIPVIKDLTEQGFHVTVYNAVYHSRRHPAELYSEYTDEAKNSELFEFKKGVVMPKIIDELHGNYHFGLLAYYFEDDLQVGKNHLKGTMASKLFTYLAAGLPVIISEQFEYMVKIVEEEGVGVVVSRKDMKHLSGILEGVDYKKMLKNVLSAQKKYSISSQLPALKKILKI